MQDIEGMTVEQHHMLCIGTLAMCYRHVPSHMMLAIFECVQAAKAMGAPIEPDNLKHGLPLALNQ